MGGGPVGAALQPPLAQACTTTPRVTVTAAPCAGVSVIFTVNARRRWWRSAALPFALRGTEKDTLPAVRDERTSRPTRTCPGCPALASDAPAANRPTSSRPPEPVWDTLIDPRTVDPRWLPASFSAFDPPSKGEPWPGSLSVVGVVGVVVVGVVVVGVVGVVPVAAPSTTISYLVYSGHKVELSNL